MPKAGLSDFMKMLLQRFTRWFNRTGTHWEDRFKSVIVESGRAELGESPHATKNEEEILASKDNETVLPDLGMAGMLMKRMRFFTDGAVIGSKEFVKEAFARERERFTERRKDGARRMRGCGASAAGTLWNIRDLRVRV
jgi:hypothetical protein